MAKETKTVQCYPDDDIINKKIDEYASFGWELINNQRCQEYEGTYDGYKHWSTFNKLTFTRDKSASWYGKVVELEKEYDRLNDTKPSEPYVKKAGWLRFFLGIIIPILALPMTAVGIANKNFILPIIGGVMILIGIVIIGTGVAKNKKYKAAYAEHRRRVREWEDDTGKKAKGILDKAAAIVSA